MPELKQNKVGIVSCSGEELAEGTVSRLAALKVLEELRPGETVTICLPLFLAGGEGDRAFARFYPTIAIDGCEKRCAFRATEMFSNTPVMGIVISGLTREQGLERPQGCRKLDETGKKLVEIASIQAAEKVDELLGRRWSRREGVLEPREEDSAQSPKSAPGTEPGQTTCSCGSGIPVLKLKVNAREVEFLALPSIFQNFLENGQPPSPQTLSALMESVKLYTPISSDIEEAARAAVAKAYKAYWDTWQERRG
ncbi:MAG TPA: putative zinc-binding protein [Anaerolineaceae bacterium]|nr:putative zinc-binding protein [Anaerolineaceae bacterium]HPS32809.1 putative zinc-binding protein [Anaerolineaceae bacterium]